MGCECKYCMDSKRIQTTKEIGENYNYSCSNHKARAELKWILLSMHNEVLREKDQYIQQLQEKIENYKEELHKASEHLVELGYHYYKKGVKDITNCEGDK